MINPLFLWLMYRKVDESSFGTLMGGLLGGLALIIIIILVVIVLCKCVNVKVSTINYHTSSY